MIVEEPRVAEVLAPRATLSAALATIGLPFALCWARAHGTDPRWLGIVVGTAAAVGVGLASAAAARRRTWQGPALAYVLLAAPAAGAVVLASCSDSMIAEGRVTAMVLPLALLAVGVVAALADLALATLGVRRVGWRRPYVLVLLVGLSAILAWQLPVVQFAHPPQLDTIHPVLGGWYAFLAGIAAGALVAPATERWSWRVAVAIALAAIAFGFASQALYGADVALLGVAVAFRPRTTGPAIDTAGRTSTGADRDRHSV